MEILFQGVLIGIIATFGMDIWTAIVKHVFRLPTADWALVGRWFGHMHQGVFFYRPTVMRLINLSMHLVFGVSLYIAWLLI